jgi:hypothetical protein
VVENMERNDQLKPHAHSNMAKLIVNSLVKARLLYEVPLLEGELIESKKINHVTSTFTFSTSLTVN